MGTDKNNTFHGDLLPPEVIRKGEYFLGQVNRVPPEVGIFDSPTRCFVVNVEWWSHIAGMVHLLADVVSWKDAEDEDYFAIREILRFMQGIECMDFALRQSPDDNCILQQTTDSGTTWTDVFDFSLCATIQDNSTSVTIQNSVTNYEPTFEEIYNNYTDNYSGSPADVYPDLSPPSGDDSALAAAYCNAIFELVKKTCDAAVTYYNESVNATQNEINVGLGIAAFFLAAIAVAGAIPTLGGSLAALAPAAGLWAAGISLGAVFGQALVDFWQSHTIDQFQDTEAMETLTCYLVDEVAAGDNSLAAMQAALVGHGLTGNAGAIADFLSIMLSHDSTYAAFLEKWNNNKQYADAGIDLYCPCASEYKVWIWDFANGMGPFTFEVAPVGSACVGTVLGVYDGTAVKGVQCGASFNGISLLMPFTPTWRIRSVKLFTRRENGIENGTFDNATLRLRPTFGTDTGGQNIISGGFRPNGADIRCNTIIVSPFYWTGANEIAVRANVSFDASPVSAIYIDRIEIMFEADFAKGGYTTDDDDLCS